MFIATMETGHFDFAGASETAESAREALANGWREHVAQFGDDITDDYCEPADVMEYCGVNVTEIRAGECVRDGSTLYPNGANR